MALSFMHCIGTPVVDTADIEAQGADAHLLMWDSCAPLECDDSIAMLLLWPIRFQGSSPCVGTLPRHRPEGRL
jgi:hypothetical protein